MGLFLKKIYVPKDLDSVSHIHAMDEVDPRQVDMSHKGVEAIWQAVKNLYRAGIHPAISICLRRKGEIVLNRAIGHARGNGPEDNEDSIKIPVTPDTPICLFSASKAVTALLIHLLAERGQIHLNDPVATYVPEFAAKGKEKITINHILTHRGGIPRLDKNTAPDTFFDHEKVLRLLCEGQPESTPGSRVSYHALTGGFIFDEIIKRVTGQDVRAFLSENITKPLGLKTFSYGLPEADRQKAAINYYTGFPAGSPFSIFIKRVLNMSWETAVDISNDPRYRERIISSGNIFATANDASKFFQLLLNNGEYKCVRIFSPETVRDAITPASRLVFDHNLLAPIRYSKGLMLGDKPFGIYGPFTQHAYGHIGFLNILCWADPMRDISVAILNNGKALLGPHLKPLIRLLHKISWHCRGESQTLPQTMTKFFKS